MEIRRPVAALFVALALVGGPASLTACSSSSGDGSNDGTTDDDSTNTSGGNPGDVSQGNLPSNNDSDPSSTEQSDNDTDG
jgi:hypothetical protein